MTRGVNMEVVVVSGSRNRNGQTAQAVDACLKGFKQAEAGVESFFLPEKKIERCRQCGDSGWGLCRSKGRCIIEDDLGLIVESICRADVIIFATPVYFGDLSESLRAFLDRLRRMCTHSSVKGLIEKRSAIGICVAGGGGAGAAECSLSLEKILNGCGFNVLDVIGVRRQNLKMKQMILQTTAERIASGKLS